MKGGGTKGVSLLAVAVIGVLALSLSSSSAFQFQSRYLQRRLRRGKSLNQHSNFLQHNAGPTTRDSGDKFVYPNSTLTKDIQRAIEGDGKRGGRSKRGTYAWPPSSLFIAQFSLEIPLYTPEGVGIPFLIEVPYEFNLPNVTESIVTGRSDRDRLTFFGTIESLFSKFGFQGESCMLRAICERAETDVLTKGLLGEVLNIVLAVSTSGLESSRLDHYKEAEFHGKSLGGCQARYVDCPISIFHFFE